MLENRVRSSRLVSIASYGRCIWGTDSSCISSNNVLIKVTLSRQRHCRGTVKYYSLLAGT